MSQTMIVWGKSGESVRCKTEKDTKVEHVRYAALDELRDKLQQRAIGSDGYDIDRKKLVLLDNLGNQPLPTDLVSMYKYLFIFVRPTRDMPQEHPDVLASNILDMDINELSQIESKLPIQTTDSALTSSQRLQQLKEQIYSRTERCREYSQVARSRADFCNRTSTALELQNRGRDAVCAHIGQLCDKVSEGYSELRVTVLEEGKKFECLLSGFEQDMKRLRSIPLHPSLQSENRTKLSDCVQDITPWKDRCHEKWQGLVAKLTEFEQDLERIKREVEDINNSLPIGQVDFEGLETARRESSETATSLRHLQQEAEACLTDVVDRMNFADQEDFEHDTTWKETIEEQGGKERQMLVRLLKVEEFCKLCGESRKRIQSFMERHVERAVNLTSEVIRLQRRVVAYNATLDGIKDYFHQLEIVRYMPAAYRWGIVEVCRRMHYHRKVACIVSTAQQTLNSLRQEESHMRKEWNSSFAPYIPEGILDSLGQPILSVRIDTTPPIYDLSYPNLVEPYQTPESTIAFYESLDIGIPENCPEPPQGLVTLNSKDMEAELDALIEGKVLRVKLFRDDPSPTATAPVANNSLSLSRTSSTRGATRSPQGPELSLADMIQSAATNSLVVCLIIFIVLFTFCQHLLLALKKIIILKKKKKNSLVMNLRLSIFNQKLMKKLLNRYK